MPIARESRRNFGDDESAVGDYAWFVGNADGGPHKVGEKKPNPWGLYDMHGNAAEWCWDWFHPYEAKPAKDPMGETSGRGRAIRGGAFTYQAGALRTAHRFGDLPENRHLTYGFRAARTCSGMRRAQPQAAVSSRSTSPASPEKPVAPVPAGEEGFVSLFDGKTLNGWQGSTDRYSVQDGKIVADFGPRPNAQGGHLFTAKEYKDFVLRLEYTLSSAANNGILLRAPLVENPWHEAIEVQILDDSAPAWQRLAPQLLNASLYGIVAARPGHLKPIGQWNSMEIQWQVRQVRVTLNAAVVVDTDLDDPKDKAGGLQHPGLKRLQGHIVLMGNASQGKVEFRNIRIKELPAQSR